MFIQKLLSLFAANQTQFGAKSGFYSNFCQAICVQNSQIKLDKRHLISIIYFIACPNMSEFYRLAPRLTNPGIS